MASFRKVQFVNLPLPRNEPALHVPGEGLAGLGVPRVLEVVVADGEFGIRLLHVGLVHDADVAAPEDRSLVGVAGDGELGQIQAELFPQVQREDERRHRFVRRPVLLARVPREWSVPADDLAVLGLHQGERAWDIVALFVELED